MDLSDVIDPELGLSRPAYVLVARQFARNLGFELYASDLLADASSVAKTPPIYSLIEFNSNQIAYSGTLFEVGSYLARLWDLKAFL